jgi:hypothetical protein
MVVEVIKMVGVIIFYIVAVSALAAMAVELPKIRILLEKKFVENTVKSLMEERRKQKK